MPNSGHMRLVRVGPRVARRTRRTAFAVSQCRPSASETYSRHLIRMARRQAGLTQTELAERAGTSQAAVSAYESGRRSPSVDTLVRILAATGLELRMRLAPPDTHTSSLAAAEALLPAEQLAGQRERDRARLARHRTSA